MPARIRKIVLASMVGLTALVSTLCVRHDLMLLGYANSSSTSLDNVIGCTILVGNDYGVGGAPPYTGHCP